MRADGVTRYCPTVTTASFEILAHGMRTIAAACEQFDAVRKAVVGIHLDYPVPRCPEILQHRTRLAVIRVQPPANHSLAIVIPDDQFLPVQIAHALHP